MGYVLQELAKYFKSEWKKREMREAGFVEVMINESMKEALLEHHESHGDFIVEELAPSLEFINQDFFNNQRIVRSLVRLQEVGAVEVVGKRRNLNRDKVNVYRVNPEVLEKAKVKVEPFVPREKAQ